MPLRNVHRRHHRAFKSGSVAWLLVCLLLAACTGLAGAGDAAHFGAQPAPDFNALFTRCGPGWTGGDGTLSIALPDGRTLWLFGDSFLGTVRPDGTRPADSPLVRNCLVVQEGQRLETLHGGSARDPEAFLMPQDPEAWYWPGDGTVSGRQVQIFFHRYRHVSPGIWGWAWDGTVMADLALPELTVQGVTETPAAGGVVYGAALLETDSWIYIYGTKRRGAVNHLHLARAPRNHLEAPWQFWTGTGWTQAATASQSLLAGVGRQFGVLPLADGFGLVSMDGRRPFSCRVVLYAADAPTGPWQGPAVIYCAPEADTGVAAYNAFVHPQFSLPGGHLISYNLNHVRDPLALYADAALYRPRFIRVDLARVAQTIRFDHRKDAP
jgi:hypothetical protein